MNTQLKQLIQNSPFRDAPIVAQVQATVRNPACGDSLTLKASIQQSTLVALSFSGQGCMLSQAALNILAHKVLNRCINNLADITFEQLCHDLALDIGPNRKQCVMLAHQSLLELLKNYRENGTRQN
jgi:nitrogen fixation protein NifU and related proteins